MAITIDASMSSYNWSLSPNGSNFLNGATYTSHSSSANQSVMNFTNGRQIVGDHDIFGKLSTITYKINGQVVANVTGLNGELYASDFLIKSDAQISSILLSGDNIIFGGTGNDYIDAGAGADSINGNGGNDYIVVGARDTVSGGDGNDTVEFSNKNYKGLGWSEDATAYTMNGWRITKTGSSIENYKFTDGVVKSYTQLVAEAKAALAPIPVKVDPTYNTADNLATDKDRPATFQELLNKQTAIQDALTLKLDYTNGMPVLRTDMQKFYGEVQQYNVYAPNVSQGVKTVLTNAMKDLSSFLDVKFSFASTALIGDKTSIQVVESTSPGKSTSYTYTSPVDNKVVNLLGDGWGNSMSQLLNSSQVDYAVNTVKHEFAHALGLTHPGMYDTVAQDKATNYVYMQKELDNGFNTIMSYDTEQSGVSTGYQEMDIIALQAIYGESKAFENACKALFLQGTENAKSVAEGVSMMEANLLAAFTPEFRNQVIKDLQAYVDYTKSTLQDAFKVVANVVVDNASNEYLDDRLEVQVIQLIAQDNSYLITQGFGG